MITWLLGTALGRAEGLTTCMSTSKSNGSADAGVLSGSFCRIMDRAEVTLKVPSEGLAREARLGNVES